MTGERTADAEYHRARSGAQKLVIDKAARMKSKQTREASERTADADVLAHGCSWMHDYKPHGNGPGCLDGCLACEFNAALDRLVARNQQLQEALADGVRVASQYLDTDRGDLDGWIDAARAALASVRARTP